MCPNDNLHCLCLFRGARGCALSLLHARAQPEHAANRSHSRLSARQRCVGPLACGQTLIRHAHTVELRFTARLTRQLAKTRTKLRVAQQSLRRAKHSAAANNRAVLVELMSKAKLAARANPSLSTWRNNQAAVRLPARIRRNRNRKRKEKETKRKRNSKLKCARSCWLPCARRWRIRS